MPKFPDSLIRQTCDRADLRTYDPYDIWKTTLGFYVKDFYNRHRVLALPAAASLTIFDTYINERMRIFYSRQEYPIVRALAAQALLKLYEQHQETSILPAVRSHLEWLAQHSCTGYSGPCWGLGFRYAVADGLVYGVNTPLTTMTPYALEAFVQYVKLTGDQAWLPTIRDIFGFFEDDVQVLEETPDYLVTSYSDKPDRKVLNAVSYVMYSYSLLYDYLEKDQRQSAARRIKKLYNYVRRNQAPDGSWLYSPHPKSFIDCFHSCIIIKNIIKTARIIDLEDWQQVVSHGYRFLKLNFLVSQRGLVKRFAKSNKPSIVRFDLYDNAEMLNLAHLMEDREMMQTLKAGIAEHFVSEGNIYSHIDWLGIRHGRNMLRWAVMPYVYALASSDVHE